MFKKIDPKLQVFFQYLLALGIFAIALFLRFWLLPVEAGYPRLTIYPATILCFFICGLGPGILVTLLSTVVSFYYFEPHHFTFELTSEAMIVLPIYLLSSLMIGLLVMKSQNFAKELLLANEHLNLSLSSQRRFIDNAAHQLRTPLAGLKVQVDRLLCADDFETLKPALAHIKSATDRVAHLSTQLLVLARSESYSQSPKEFKVIDLTKLACNCSMDWAPKALERNMDLGFDAPADLPYVKGDETLLCELLSNLLDNAVCYGNISGKINVKIEVNSQVLLIIEDDGPGIQPSEVDKVFERFYRIPGSKGEGCGLGLAIVKEIADLHAATVKIGVSSLGNGTRFEIAFKKSLIGHKPLPKQDRV